MMTNSQKGALDRRIARIRRRRILGKVTYGVLVTLATLAIVAAMATRVWLMMQVQVLL